MPIYFTTEYGFRIDLDHDQDDGELVLLFHTPRGVVRVDIDPGQQELIELANDERERQEDCHQAVVNALSDLDDCYPGETFSHFADEPDDSSIIVTRSRTAREIEDARCRPTYRDLANAGLSDADIRALTRR